ncbi:monooxygenase 1-like [Phragmites australis]|uniref:monooxygenase 1-like n=1 Tax=Phragmites australis TaxID=29695 RepID=UPI002D78431F|nr:monooxygenase 1-like [Phragmites australis]
MEEETHGIVIIGGGICGLATALALHRKGIASLVLEKSETLRADGATIGIHANGWRVLDQLGVAAELRETANLITAYHDAWLQGNKSNLIPIRNEFRRVNRKDLIETLAKNLPVGSIRFGCHIAAIHEDPGIHGAVLTTMDGSTIRAKVLIGCDGTNSVAAKYLGLSVPKPIPRTVLRGFTRYPHGHPFGTEFLRLRGENFFLGRLPVTDDLVHFFVTCPNPSTGITKDVGAMKDFVLEKLQECPAEITEMVRASDPESLNVVAKLWYRPPWQVMFGTFQKGAVTVAGDAMHAMGPFIGQGGSAGLEDAVVLARSLARATVGREPCDKKTIGVAIGKYVRERRPRVAMLSLESYVVGTLLRAKWHVTKLACVAVLALVGSRSLRHTDYDCGRL